MKRKPTAVYTFKTVPYEWRDCTVWARPSVEHLTVDERARFDRLELAIKTYLESGALKAAAEAGQCSKQTVIDKLNRCLTLNDDGSIVGWRGLLPYERLGSAPYRRRNLPTGSRAAEKGAAGSLETFLCKHEDIRISLHQAIRRGGDVKGKGKSHNPKSRSVYSAFKKVCIAAGLTMNDYPLNSKSKGRRSIERYIYDYIPTDPASVETWYGVDARDRMSLGTGKKRFPIAMAPLDLCGGDAHEMHCYGVIIVPGPAGPQAVPIERIWIYPIVDFQSRCVLRYAISIRTEINTETIEEALAACDEPWKPRDLYVEEVVALTVRDFEPPTRFAPGWSFWVHGRPAWRGGGMVSAAPPLSDTIGRWMKRHEPPRKDHVTFRIRDRATSLTDISGEGAAERARQVLRMASSLALRRGAVQEGMRLRDRTLVTLRGAFSAHRGGKDERDWAAELTGRFRAVQAQLRRQPLRWDWRDAETLWTEILNIHSWRDEESMDASLDRR
jgi:hypothetical protein